jgi:hypothetical protein
MKLKVTQYNRDECYHNSIAWQLHSEVTRMGVNCLFP